jgi:PAS domain S-box-containing protein
LIRIDLHLHSSFSLDGVHPLEELARLLARGEVSVAALTDHDTLDGQVKFRHLLKARGIGFISGVEITTSTRWGELHILAYGFDLESGSLKQLLAGTPGERTLEKTLEVVHQSGGKAFLAHPLVISDDWSEVESVVEELATQGLDGIEVFYGPYPVEDQERLLELADRLGLHASGGSDFHDHEDDRTVGVDIPRELWKNLRSCLTSLPRTIPDHSEPLPPLQERREGLHWGRFLARILLPTVVSLVLFIVTLFAIIIPKFERSLLDRKQEMIRELTNSATSILAEYYEEEIRGRMTRQEAQEAAIARIKGLRYGKEDKDYFWLMDSHPNMIMHPYLPEMDNTDVSDFTDSKGARIFIEFVKAVEDNEAGYVEYFWQWKDDQTRIAPKLSYVRKFAPWGWIIGTGIYLEDVRKEIGDVTQDLIRITVIITIALGLLLAFIVHQSLRIERKRSVAATALRVSHEKYRSLVEASTEGAVILSRGRVRYSNESMQDLLRCPEEELHLMDVVDLVAPAGSGDENVAERLMRNELLPRPVETRLQARGGKPVHVILSTSPIQFGGQDGLIVMARRIADRPRDTTETSREDGTQVRALEDQTAVLQHDLLFLTRRMETIMRPHTTCPADASVQRLARLMKQSGDSAVVVVGDSGHALGLITGRDLRERAPSDRNGPAKAAHEIMSAPLIGISREGLVHEALTLMRGNDVDYLVIRDDESDVCGIVSGTDLLRAIDTSHLISLAEIDASESPEDLAGLVDRQQNLVAPLIRGSRKPAVIGRLLSRVMDRAVAKACEFAIAELGPPPAAFAFIGLGSLGREELTLASDQDTAIIHLGDKATDGRAGEYFSKLGGMVTDWLCEAGYPRCSGDNMASNPKWCKSLADWKATFREWIVNPANQELLEFSIFFDFRCIVGEQELIDALRKHVDQELGEHPPFFILAAENAQHYRSPIGAFGNLITTSTETGDRVLNLKAALLQIINFARIHALANSIASTNTLSRLGQLRSMDIIQRSIYEEAVQAYNHLMGIRLRSQLKEGADPDHRGVRISDLTSLEQSMLKQIFAHLNLLNKNISSHFLAG